MCVFGSHSRDATFTRRKVHRQNWLQAPGAQDFAGPDNGVLLEHCANKTDKTVSDIMIIMKA